MDSKTIQLLLEPDEISALRRFSSTHAGLALMKVVSTRRDQLRHQAEDSPMVSDLAEEDFRGLYGGIRELTAILEIDAAIDDAYAQAREEDAAARVVHGQNPDGSPYYEQGER